MPRTVLHMGSQLKLRYRLFPRHPLMKASDHSTCMVDMPAGCPAVVIGLQGSNIEFAIFRMGGGPTSAHTPVSALPKTARTDMIVPLHMVDELFVA